MAIKQMDFGCDWCNEKLDSPDHIKVVGSDGEVLARFHDGTCYTEAKDYGWG